MSDAPYRSSSLLPMKRSRQAAASPGDPPTDLAAPAPRRAKSVSDVRYREPLGRTSTGFARADKGKAKATVGTSSGGRLGAGAADGWKGDMFGRFVEKALRDAEELVRRTLPSTSSGQAGGEGSRHRPIRASPSSDWSTG
jgi:hypothetical protein